MCPLSSRNTHRIDGRGKVFANTTSQQNTTGLQPSSMLAVKVLPAIIGLALAFALLIMGILILVIWLHNQAFKNGICRSRHQATARCWYGKRLPDEATCTDRNSKHVFLQRHLEALRAWQKPKGSHQPPIVGQVAHSYS